MNRTLPYISIERFLDTRISIMSFWNLNVIQCVKVPYPYSYGLMHHATILPNAS